MTDADFDNWFATPIRTMNADPHGGFAVLMLTLPLAERYFRHKTGIGDGQLNDAFHNAFRQPFGLSLERSKQFWHVYRNGLLHQATFSRATRGSNTNPNGSILPSGWIMTQNLQFPEIINYSTVHNEFVVDPKLFSEKIISIIKADFATFDAPNDVKHPPSRISIPKSYSTTVSTVSDSPLPRATGNKPQELP